MWNLENNKKKMNPINKDNQMLLQHANSTLQTNMIFVFGIEIVAQDVTILFLEITCIVC